MELGVSALLRPEIEWDGGEFVDEGVGEAVFAEVDGLEVGAASVATLDADIGELLGGIDRQFGMVFFVATGADDAAELPLAETESTEQVAAGAIAQLPEYAQRGTAAAERAQRVIVARQLKRNPGADEFSVGLKKGHCQEFTRIGGRLVNGGPGVVQQVGPGTGGRLAEIVRNLRHASWGLLFDQREKWREAGQEFRQFRRAGWRDVSLAGRGAFEAVVKILLETRSLDIEGEDLPGAGMLSGQSFGAPDPLLPDSFRHRAIMGLRPVTGNCVGYKRLWWHKASRGLTVARDGDIVLGNFGAQARPRDAFWRSTPITSFR